jgi:NADH-quinone oxidoreductase subunit J
MHAFLFMDLSGSVQKLDFWTVIVPALLGMAAVYLFLPGVKQRSFAAAGGLGAAALIVAGIFLVREKVFDVTTFLFYAFAAVGLISGALLVGQENPVRAALSFAVVVLSTCGLFLLQGAPFLMAATIIVYAGAIIVTFAFVIMLARQTGRSDADQRSREPFMACVAGFVLLVGLLLVLQVTYKANDLNVTASAPSLPADNVAGLGRTLFTDYLLAVELGGTLLLVAAIGAIAIASRRTEALR